MKNNYFINKEANIAHAKEIYELNQKTKQAEINNCIAHTQFYNENMEFPLYIVYPDIDHNTIDLSVYTTIQAISDTRREDNITKTAALNFASYKNPGGMFMQGSMAQEESLCHNSTLYNILKHFDDTYYANNRKALNKGLYLNRALYTPGVYFYGGYYCDIITCAAPNINPVKRYGTATDEEIENTIRSRIEFVLDIAALNGVGILILGAFGCGVFGNNPRLVASIFKELLLGKFYHCFREVKFAIPAGENYSIFREVFEGER